MMTHEEIFKEVLKLHQTLLEIQQALIRLEDLPRRIEDHEHRLRDIEAFTNRAKGGIALAAIAGGTVSGLVIAAIQMIIG